MSICSCNACRFAARFATPLLLALVVVAAPIAAVPPDINPEPMFKTQLIVCPNKCIECGDPRGLICCLPEHICTVIWWPIWFLAPDEATPGSSQEGLCTATPERRFAQRRVSSAEQEAQDPAMRAAVEDDATVVKRDGDGGVGEGSLLLR